LLLLLLLGALQRESWSLMKYLLTSLRVMYSWVVGGVVGCMRTAHVLTRDAAQTGQIHVRSCNPQDICSKSAAFCCCPLRGKHCPDTALILLEEKGRPLQSLAVWAAACR
jgi:hypothetical protein